MQAIYAVDSKKGLSKNGIIPWKSKKDMQFFVNKTKNNTVVMGRNTYYSLPQRPLKNRKNIVLTNEPHLYSEPVLFTSFYEKEKDEKIFFIGGKTIYEQFIPLCEKVWVTEIKGDYDCDLIMDYDFTGFSSRIHMEDEELKIIEYFK